MSELNKKLIDYGGLEHFRDMLLNDSASATGSTWSSNKINTELSGKASIDYVDEQIEAVIGAGNSDIEGKETEDFTFVQTLPVEGEEGQQVIIKGDNTDTLYKYVSGEWVEQTPDATKLYFDTENEVLYSYATAEHQFVRISMVNTIVVGSNLNSNADLKALKTVGVYNVVQRLHNATKGDYVKNWTLYVESVDYEEYDKSDSVYQRLVSNYTIQKRTWSATRQTNDGWSNFSTYYAGEIKDTTTSKYYTWSSNKIAAQIAAIPQLEAGENVSIENGRINALGYKFDENKWSFSELYGREVQSLNQEIPISQVGMSDVKVTGLANSTTYTVSGTDVAQFLQMMPSMLSVINTIKLSNGKTGVISSIDATNSTITVAETIDAVNALNEVPIAAFLMAIEITLSGAANATTYTYTEPEEILSPTSTKFMIIEGYGEREAVEINTTNHTITFTETLDAENAVTDALIEAFVSYNSLASGEGSHSEGIDTEAKGRGTHAEGQSTSASGSFGAHAEGYYTVANGDSSHAEGSNTKTNNAGEHAEGFNNVSHNLDRYQTSHKTISSIGIGDSSTSKNGVEVMWSGDMYLYGVGGYDGVHIKHETGYSNVKTLQEVVNSKADAYETATTADIEAMFS